VAGLPSRAGFAPAGLLQEVSDPSHLLISSSPSRLGLAQRLPSPIADLRHGSSSARIRGRSTPVARRNHQSLYRILVETRTAQDQVLISGVAKLHAEHIAASLREHLRVAG
jgi:hypothetical protein